MFTELKKHPGPGGVFASKTCFPSRFNLGEKHVFDVKNPSGLGCFFKKYENRFLKNTPGRRQF